MSFTIKFHCAIMPLSHNNSLQKILKGVFFYVDP